MSGILGERPYLVPLILDAAAIRVLFVSDAAAGDAATPMREAILARWVGESANSLMPAGQIGGPVLMARHLSLRGMPLPEAVATLVGLHAETGLALSLAKRARELLLGLRGLVYLHWAERGGARTVRQAPR